MASWAAGNLGLAPFLINSHKLVRLQARGKGWRQALEKRQSQGFWKGADWLLGAVKCGMGCGIDRVDW